MAPKLPPPRRDIARQDTARQDTARQDTARQDKPDAGRNDTRDVASPVTPAKDPVTPARDPTVAAAPPGAPRKRAAQAWADMVDDMDVMSVGQARDLRPSDIGVGFGPVMDEEQFHEYRRARGGRVRVVSRQLFAK